MLLSVSGMLNASTDVQDLVMTKKHVKKLYST